MCFLMASISSRAWSLFLHKPTGPRVRMSNRALLVMSSTVQRLSGGCWACTACWRKASGSAYRPTTYHVCCDSSGPFLQNCRSRRQDLSSVLGLSSVLHSCPTNLAETSLANLLQPVCCFGTRFVRHILGAFVADKLGLDLGLCSAQLLWHEICPPHFGGVRGGQTGVRYAKIGQFCPVVVFPQKL
jgi:hypothetical protein